MTDDAGLVEPLTGMYGHAAAMDDVNGDGFVDVLVGSFADRPDDKYAVRGADGPAPDRLLLGGKDGFRPAPDFPELYGRSSGAAFSDLDGDGDADLVLARNVSGGSDRDGASGERAQAPTTLLRNEGGGRFTMAGELAPTLAARAVVVFDYDGDGRLDLYLVRDRRGGGTSTLLRNEGGLRFKPADAGLPDDVTGLGAIGADLNGDRRPDLFVAGSNRLFLNEGARFRELRTDVFDWETFGDEDDVAGVAVGDLDRNGRPDLVVGQHFNSTVDRCRRVPVRLYLNKGGAQPVFEDVTEKAGIPAFPTKAPHVEVQDFDNDGWLDILTTASAGAGSRPAILRRDREVDGVPHFAAVNGLGSPQYWVTGATADVDRDGRIDVFLVEFEPSLPSLLLRNVTPDVGRWLTVDVGPAAAGAVIEVYRAGGLGRADQLVARRDVVTGVGYAAGAPSLVHVGVGDLGVVDVRVTPTRPGTAVEKRNVAAGTVVRARP